MDLFNVFAETNLVRIRTQNYKGITGLLKRSFYRYLYLIFVIGLDRDVIKTTCLKKTLQITSHILASRSRSAVSI